MRLLRNLSSETRGVLWVNLSNICAVAPYLGYTYGVRFFPEIHPLQLTFWGVSTAWLIGLPFFVARQKERTRALCVVTQKPFHFSAYLACVIINWAAWIIALQSIGPGPLSLLTKTQIIFAVLLGIFALREKLPAKQLPGLSLATLGFVSATLMPGEVTAIGASLAIISAAAAGLSSFIIKRYIANIDGLAFAWVLSGMLAISFGIIIAATDAFTIPPIELIVLLGVLQFCGAIIGRAAYLYAHNLLPMTQINIYILGWPALTLVAAYFFFGDPITPQKIFGAVAITLGLAWFARSRSA